MKFNGENFINQTVDIDNNEFINCKFEKCTLVYHGGKPPVIVNCDLNETSFTFVDAAASTLQFMTAMYHGGFRVIIDQTFENIRLNRTGGKMTFH